AGDRHRRRLLRQLPPPSGFHPDLRLPGRHAAVADQPARAVPPGRPEGGRALQFRPGLCADPGDLAGPLRPGRRPGGENGLRRPLSPHVALLPRLLRGRLLDRAHGRIAGPLPTYITVIKQGAESGANQEGYIRVHAPMTRTGSAAASVRLTFGRLIAYSTNQLPLNMAALPVVLNVSHFYGEVLKVPLGIMGLIFIAARVIDAIQDPVIGLISDKFTHKGPRGRLTFVALTLPLMIGGFYMLFHPPEALFTQSTLLAIWLFVALFIVHLGYAGVSISYHAHGAELSDDYNERTRITVGREVFGLMGMTLAVVLPTILTAPSMFGEHQGYVYMGLIFIPVALAFALPTLLWSPASVHPPVVREHPEIHVRYFRDWLVSLAPSLARPTRNMEHSTSLKTLVPFFAPMKNRLFRRLLLVFIINGSALGVAVSVMLFYVEHVLKGNKT